MLLKLSGRALRPRSKTSSEPFIARVTQQADLPEPSRTEELLLVTGSGELPPGFRGYLCTEDRSACDDRRDVFVLAAEYHYLADGDVLRVDPNRGTLSTLYRRSSPSNSFLVTERCDNYCVMCSQPPKERDDSWLVDDLVRVIPLVSPETRELGITGGEPGLLGQRLVHLLELMRETLPNTAVHVLSNGRAFKSLEFAREIGAVRHPDLMIGIPLYSDVSNEHDYVVQARGAFDETIRGILNLKQSGVRVELRFVIHRETYASLPTFAEFVARNLLFVDHVALMGLEQMGFARSNIDTIWIDPLDYEDELVAAVRVLQRARMNISIYNHQLCVIPVELHPFARASISDWKQTYVDTCEPCAQREHCGGFFGSSTVQRSRGIAAILD